MTMKRERGFSLVEVLVAGACAVVMLVVLTAMASRFLAWARSAEETVLSRATADQLVDRWNADAASAWAVFTPPVDIFGRSNADGHELDFMTETSSHEALFWAYTFDAVTRTLTRNAYIPGGVPTADSGLRYAGVSSFYAQTYDATALSDATSPAYDALFASATIVPVTVGYGFGPSILGGNRITRVRVAAGRELRTVTLASATAPSRFTIVLDYTPAPSPAP
jgi:type II secretory pathway pseudopilin PulG